MSEMHRSRYLNFDDRKFGMEWMHTPQNISKKENSKLSNDCNQYTLYTVQT